MYSVLIHSGAAIGGHYYAYIKSFDDGFWYRFDDQQVVKIQESEIYNVFGEKRMSSGPTAYMLMYKQYDPLTKDKPVQISDDLIPSYLADELE